MFKNGVKRGLLVKLGPAKNRQVLMFCEQLANFRDEFCQVLLVIFSHVVVRT